MFPSPFDFLDGLTYTGLLLGLVLLAIVLAYRSTRGGGFDNEHDRGVLCGLIVLVGAFCDAVIWVAVIVR